MSKLSPAYYGGWRDWWTLLHPPYTLMHLSFVVVGAALAPAFDPSILLATLLAFFLAVGIAAHALDELVDRPLDTSIPSRTLVLSAICGLFIASGIGIVGVLVSNGHLIWFVLVGVFLAVSYNLELFGGVFHTDLWFGLAWGAFPVLTSHFAQTGVINSIGILGAMYGLTMALTQRHLSTPARHLRRKAIKIDCTIYYQDGASKPIDRHTLLKPLEDSLQMLVLSSIFIAIALLGLRLLSS